MFSCIVMKFIFSLYWLFHCHCDSNIDRNNLKEGQLFRVMTSVYHDEEGITEQFSSWFVEACRNGYSQHNGPGSNNRGLN